MEKYLATAKLMLETPPAPPGDGITVTNIESAAALEQKLHELLQVSKTSVMRTVDALLVVLYRLPISVLGHLVHDFVRGKKNDLPRMLGLQNLLVKCPPTACMEVFSFILETFARDVAALGQLNEAKRTQLIQTLSVSWVEPPDSLNALIQDAFRRQRSTAEMVVFSVALRLGTFMAFNADVASISAKGSFANALGVEKECFPQGEKHKWISRREDRQCVAALFLQTFIKFRGGYAGQVSSSMKGTGVVWHEKSKEELLAATVRLLPLYRELVCDKLSAALPWRVAISREGREDPKFSAILIRVNARNKALGKPLQNMLQYTVLVPGSSGPNVVYREITGNKYVTEECMRLRSRVGTSFSSSASVEVRPNVWDKISRILPLVVRSFSDEDELKSFLAAPLPVQSNPELCQICADFAQSKLSSP